MRLDADWHKITATIYDMGAPDKQVIFDFANFELDVPRHELRRDGSRVSIQEQPYQILLLLLERGGELVTRDELRDRLWPEGHYVEFEKGINMAVMKLREALSDSATAPRFIETVPRLGYRFIGEVTEHGDAASSVEPVVEAVKAPGPRVRVGVWILAVVVVSAVAAVAYFARRSGEPRTPVVRSVAVLPFDDQSPGRGEAYFAEGMTDELITSLSQLHGLKVTSRTSALVFKQSGEPIPEIARRLGVDAVVEGSIARSQGRVRVSAQLIHGATDTHIWAGTYEREASGLWNLQNEIAEDISREISLSLTPREQQRLARRESIERAAYEEYLKGRYHRDRRTMDGFVKAVRSFRRATEIDPEFAPAWAGLAQTYASMGFLGVLSPDAAHREGKAAAERALALDPDLAESHFALADVLLHYEWGWSDAEAEFKRGVDLSPSHARGHGFYALLLAARGRHAEALSEARKAVELDPLSPVLSVSLAFVYYVHGDFDDAVRACRGVLDLAPDFPEAFELLANAHASAGRDDAAFQALMAQGESTEMPADERAELREAYETSGLAGVWHALLEIERRDEEETGNVWSYRRAILLARAGDRDEAMRWLEIAFEERSPRFIFLTVDPAFASLRDDPRFATLARRLHSGGDP